MLLVDVLTCSSLPSLSIDWVFRGRVFSPASDLYLDLSTPFNIKTENPEDRLKFDRSIILDSVFSGNLFCMPRFNGHSKEGHIFIAMKKKVSQFSPPIKIHHKTPITIKIPSR